MRLILFLLCSLLFQVTSAQDPCKTFPKQGYTGTCFLSMLMTEDGKYVYTSDQITLKKWDAEKKIVTEEIPFSHKLVANTGDPEIIVVEDSKHYSLKRKSLINEQEEFIASLDAETAKALAKAKKKGYRYTLYDTRDRFIFMDIDNQIMQLSLSTNQLNTLFEYEDYRYDQDLNTFFYLEPKTKTLSSFNVNTFSKVQTNTPGIYGSLVSAPRGLYYMVKGTNDLKFLDLNYKEVAKVPFAGNIKWRKDSSSFFVYGAQYYQNLFYYVNGFVQEYSYPGLKMIGSLNQAWHDDQYRYGYYFVDPDKQMVYVQQGSHARREEKPVLLGYNIATSSLKDSISFRYTLTKDESDVIAQEREQRRKIGNHAIEALYSMPTPQSFHSLNVTKITDDFTPRGKVLIREEYHGSAGACILWSFPEGKAVNQYYDRTCHKLTGIGPGAVAVPTYRIYKSFLSPSGKLVGLNTQDGAMVYEGSALKFTLQDKYIITLLNQYVLVAESKSEALEVVDIASGQTLHKIKNGKPTSSSKIEKHLDPTKVFFYNQYGVNVFDVNNPSVIQNYFGAKAKESGFGNYYFDWRERKNYETGKKERVPGYRPPEFMAGNATEKFQHNYMLFSDAIEGFKVMDARTAEFITSKPLYSGWTQLNEMVYLKDLNKVLVLNGYPVYLKPNASPEDPGASAYTFDISTGEITPYLLTENRAAMQAMSKERELRVAGWEYAAKSDCKYGLKFTDGTTIRSGDNYLIVLGYDCEEKVYVVSTRELYKEPGQGTYRQRVRIEKRTPVSLSSFESIGKVWEICTNCAGQPERTHVSSFTGWTAWEQQNFNIYTRKFVTNKRIEEQTKCKLCEGGWQRKK